MDCGVLGPLEVVDGGRRVALGGKRQRAVLALLLLRRNRPVPLETIVDALWGECTPPTAAKTVQVYVSRLRKVLPEGRLTTGPGGYTISVEDDELDLGRFERLVSQADGQDPRAAAGLLHEALSLFRGPPLEEVDFLQAEKARIEELRLAAIEARIGAELSLGEHVQLVGELEELAAEQPFREGFPAQLMLALYRSGRQAEALEVFRATRRRLTDELGIEPGPELRTLEVRILNHDPTLLPARADPVEAERIRELLERGRARIAAEMAGADELEEAREAALALGDPESAAEAETWLGQLAWVLGDQMGCFGHLERALLLVESRPPSRAKALVLDILARRSMTAADYERAVRFGRDGLVLCTELADDEGRAENLNTVGTARAFSGDRAGVAELDEAIAVARIHAHGRALARACLNLAVVFESYGEEMARIPELEEEGLRAAERAGDAPLIRAFRAREPVSALHEGRWDDAMRNCDELIAEAELTPHYEERLPRMVRAAVGVGTGEIESAVRDSRRAIQLCRAVRDPQALYVTLAWAAGIFADAGQIEESRECAQEALGLWLETGLALPPAAWILAPAVVLAGSPRLAEALAAAGAPTRWLEAARAIAADDWVGAADLIATTSYRDTEAALRLRAAEELRTSGRHGEAEKQLQRALAFYWRVGATLHLSRAERLMAISA